jgi:hypothetical protein
MYLCLGGTLPVPFNIVPTPKSVYYFFRRTLAFIKRLINPNQEEQNSTETNNSLPSDFNRPRTNNIGVPTVSNGQMTNINLNDNNYRTRQGSFDVNQRLTYRKVMNRVIKRFLLHKQREEQEEIREGDFEELKQDIQMLRFEMLNRLDETRDDLYKSSHLLNEGVLIVGELLSSLINDSNPIIKENFYLFKKSFYTRTDSGIESTTSTFSTISNSTLKSNNQQELDIRPINCLQQASLTHIALARIVEEEEIEARHRSIQTTMDNNDHIYSKF